MALVLVIVEVKGNFGYNNGANTKGKNKGVQARILNMNSRTFYMP